eukprot:m.270901 g.270901  ORF g.270901 m.270901 type:complete len:76 (+) comp92093_c0_seq1:770-997(+)
MIMVFPQMIPTTTTTRTYLDVIRSRNFEIATTGYSYDDFTCMSDSKTRHRIFFRIVLLQWQNWKCANDIGGVGGR